MTQLQLDTDRDGLLSQLLPLLAERGVARRWAESETPYSDLADDCRAISQHEPHAAAISQFLHSNPIVRLSVQTYLQHTIVASYARADQIPMPGRLLAHQGVWIGRWLPNFLVVNGPLSRLLTSPESPLNQILRTAFADYPTLGYSRDLYNSNPFRHIRNGVAHWSFAFNGHGPNERLVCYDWETGNQTVDVPVLVAEAFNVASMSVIDCLDHNVFRNGNENAL